MNQNRASPVFFFFFSRTRTEPRPESRNAMGVKIVGSIDKVNAKDLTYTDFVQRYLVKNKPVVLTGLMDDWRACTDWVLHDGKPNLKFFSTHFGNSIVQVADCGTREFTDQKRLEMSVSEFVEQWVLVDSDESSGFSPLYLKDWHFVKEYPEYTAYTTPVFFLDDWLNIYLDQFRMHQNPDTCQEKDDITCSDYRFVYMGAKGTWTPLHADVFRSYSWSANVCGKKQWYFLPPDQSHLVFDRNMKCSVYDIFEDVNETMFPGFDKALWSQCIQEKNEIIFVPSGWFHQVHNLEDTISINHNWFNAYNLSWVWDLLLRDYNEAKEYIEDIKDICDDFEGLCQRNLAANTGMNFDDFFIFIVRFSLANLVQLYHLSQEYGNPITISSQKAKHLAFNLESAREITLKLKSMVAISNCGLSIDFMEIHKDPAFLQMCMVLGRTYEMLHEPHNPGRSTEDLVTDISHFNLDESSAYHVCNPETLASLIDSALKKLSRISDEGEVR